MTFENIINRWKKFNPDTCHLLGLHEFDGILPDLSLSRIKSRIEELEKDLKILGEVKAENKKERFELNLLKQTLENELYTLKIDKPFLYDPNYWVGFGRGWGGTIGQIEMSYTQKNYTSVDDRVKAIIELEQQIPEFLQLAKERLQEQKLPLSRPKIKLAIHQTKGHYNFLNDQLISFVMKVDEVELLDEWSEYNILAVDALRDFLEFLDDQYTNGTNEFALGKEKFLLKLAMTEGVDIDIETLLDVGYEELRNNHEMLKEIADRRTDGDVTKLIDTVMEIQPSAENLLEFVKESNDMAKEFLEKTDLVTIPTDDQCMVIETPEGMREFAFAAMNTPGPFEPPEASQAYYWVTPVDPNWDNKRTKDHLRFFNKAMTHNITIHEAWPGHYLQLLWNNKAESEIAKMFARSYSMVEGWGLYSEEMIFNQGYTPMDRDYYHVGQIFGALIRVVRYLAAIQLHCKGMNIDEAQNLFVEKAFMPPGSAKVEANRGAVDPMYLNYTLGKLLIKKLRKDYQQEKGERFDLKEFHDSLLSYGSAPITVLRSILLKRDNRELL